MSFINVSSTRGDYALVNLEQVAWATVETNEAGGASRITLHMVDGATFLLRDAEAEHALEALSKDLGEPPRGMPACPTKPVSEGRYFLLGASLALMKRGRDLLGPGPG